MAARPKKAAESFSESYLLRSINSMNNGPQSPRLACGRLSQADGFVVSEKHAKALKTQRVVEAEATTSCPTPIKAKEAMLQKSVAGKREKTNGSGWSGGSCRGPEGAWGVKGSV